MKTITQLYLNLLQESKNRLIDYLNNHNKFIDFRNISVTCFIQLENGSIIEEEIVAVKLIDNEIEIFIFPTIGEYFGEDHSEIKKLIVYDEVANILNYSPFNSTIFFQMETLLNIFKVLEK